MKAASLVFALGLSFLAGPSGGNRITLPDIVANDNRVPAGWLHGDTLELALDVRMGSWRPESDTGPAVEVAAFAERGQAPTIPAPLIRVPAGTLIIARLHNLLPDSSLAIHGLFTRPAGQPDSLVLAPRDSAILQFRAGEVGTYLYKAVPGAHSYELDEEREQMAGAFIVDPPGGSPPDRVFVMNIWGRQMDSATYGNALTINGRSWPWTERIRAQVGDTLRWRVINASGRNHPMHLHGFYFRMDSHGDFARDTLYPAEDRPLLVTQGLLPFRTMTMVWSPDRPGNWLFHCHIGFHVLPEARVNPPGHDHEDYRAHDPLRHMSGLILGIEVQPRADDPPESRDNPERLRLFIQEGRPRGRALRALGFVLQEGHRPPAPDSVVLPGTPLILTRGRPTDVVVVNRLREASVIHWHGVELESYSDGVAGWSGMGDRIAPSVEPGDSFVARLTLPRAGTFIYHTHLNDIEQLTSGLYGGIVVLEPGRRWDPDTDHLYVAGWDSPAEDSAGPRILLNGDSLPAARTLRAGVTHRFRFINIGPAARFNIRIYRDTTLAEWRVVAKDGADFPPRRRRLTPARFRFDVGETFDAEVVFRPGTYRLVAALGPAHPFYEQRLVVR